MVKEYKAMGPAFAPAHPGELLREELLPAAGLTVAGAADALGISRQTLHKILAEQRAVTPEMALRLGKLFGNGPELWLGMQQAHDLWCARRQLAGILDGIETVPAV
jgi:antitoxin HigA-1